MEDLTLNEQARGVHGFPLDAVRPAGIGTPVLPGDGEHRQAPVTHLRTTREDPGARAETPSPGGCTPAPARHPPSFPASHGRELPALFKAG